MDKNFVRIGKWFVRPYDKDEKPVNKRSVFRVLLLFCFLFLDHAYLFTEAERVGTYISSCCSWATVLSHTACLCLNIKMRYTMWSSVRSCLSYFSLYGLELRTLPCSFVILPNFSSLNYYLACPKNKVN